MERIHPTLEAVKNKLAAQGLHGTYAVEHDSHLLFIPFKEAQADAFAKKVSDELGDDAPSNLTAKGIHAPTRIVSAAEAYLKTHGPVNVRLDVMHHRGELVIKMNKGDQHLAYNEIIPDLEAHGIVHELIPKAEGMVMHIPRTPENTQRIGQMLTEWHNTLRKSEKTLLEPLLAKPPGRFARFVNWISGNEQKSDASNGSRLFLAWIQKRIGKKRVDMEQVESKEPHFKILIRLPKR